jgi:hypothetical protein
VNARQSLNPGTSSIMVGEEGSPMFTLSSKQHGVLPGREPFGWDERNVTSPANRTRVTPGMSGTIHTEGLRVVQPLCVTGPTTHALTSEGCDGSEDGTGRGTPMVVQLREPVAFVERNGKVRAATTSPALMAQTGATGNQLPSVTQPIADTLTDGANQTWGHPGETVAQPWPDVAPTLTERDHKGAGNFHNGELQATVVQERPRRLMPIETERLMGWPDSWTAEGVDEQGRRYALKDTPRYRLCGNGVGAPVAEWIGRRLMDAVAARRERAA